MAHYDCSCCGESFGVSHEHCEYCKSGKCHRSRQETRARMIAANAGPLFPTAMDVIVRRVPAGTAVDGSTVTDEHVVVRDREVFITQANWEFLLGMTEVRRV